MTKRFCGRLCASGYREDRRYGIFSGPTVPGCCTYCKSYVPSHAGTFQYQEGTWEYDSNERGASWSHYCEDEQVRLSEEWYEQAPPIGEGVTRFVQTLNIWRCECGAWKVFDTYYTIVWEGVAAGESEAIQRGLDVAYRT